MKIILLANHSYAIPLLHALAAQKLIQAVVMPTAIHEGNQQLALAAQQSRTPMMRFDQTEMSSNFAAWLAMQQPDLVISYTFSYKLPEAVLKIPTYGIVNIHYSLLPSYGGPFPIFRQLKNGEKTTGITIHQMDKNWDTGPILLQQTLAILPGETQGLLSARLSGMVVPMVGELLLKLSQKQLKPQVQHTAEGSYDRKPDLTDFKIDWQTQSANAIENLVNACNPDVGGAVTIFRGQYIKLLEVGRIVAAHPVAEAGTIVNSDATNGVIVACLNNELIRINVLRMAEGYYSGLKFALLGVMAGEKLS